MKSKKSPQQRGGIFPKIVILFFVGFAGLFLFVVIFGKEVPTNDVDFLAQYQPSPEMADIALTTALSDKSKVLFYKSDPVFVGEEEFTENCLVNEGIEMALGCARVGLRSSKIYLLTIDNPEFIDHKYPAAIHELMHVVYDKLSAQEKSTLKQLLQQEFSNRQDDAHLVFNMNTLANANADIENELHSVFAVEYTDLSPELESYYSQYFIDRTQVVGLYQNGGLESRIRRMEELTQELSQLNIQLTQQSGQLQTFQAAGDLDSYNSIVGPFNIMVAKYNAMAAETQQIYTDVSEFYRYFNPKYQPPQKQ